MDNLALARATMGTSLGFHIVFAVLGVGMPLLMSVAEGLALLRNDRTWMALARRWARAFGILFAVGAVSGTALSFELGLLWPRFMAFSGAIIGLPFSAEAASNMCSTSDDATSMSRNRQSIRLVSSRIVGVVSFLAAAG